MNPRKISAYSDNFYLLTPMLLIDFNSNSNMECHLPRRASARNYTVEVLIYVVHIILDLKIWEKLESNLPVCDCLPLCSYNVQIERKVSWLFTNNFRLMLNQLQQSQVTYVLKFSFD